MRIQKLTLDPKTWSDGVVKNVLLFALVLVIVESGIQPVGAFARIAGGAIAGGPRSRQPEARSAAR